MKTVMRLVLVVALASPLGANAPNDEATLQLGMRQVKEATFRGRW